MHLNDFNSIPLRTKHTDSVLQSIPHFAQKKGRKRLHFILVGTMSI